MRIQNTVDNLNVFIDNTCLESVIMHFDRNKRRINRFFRDLYQSENLYDIEFCGVDLTDDKMWTGLYDSLLILTGTGDKIEKVIITGSLGQKGDGQVKLSIDYDQFSARQNIRIRAELDEVNID